MDIYAHSGVSVRCLEKVRRGCFDHHRARFSTEVRDEWTRRTRKTWATQVRSAQLQELFFSESFQNTRRNSYIPAQELLFA